MADQRPEAPAAHDNWPQSIRFHYIKAQGFRTIHVDGALGGVTPRGYIHAAIYSERKSIPRISEQRVQPDGTLGPDRTIRTKRHVTRELEADLVLDPKAARELADWLNKRADEVDALMAEAGKP